MKPSGSTFGLSVVLAMALAAPAGAQDAAATYWQHDPAEPGRWFEPDNWTAGVPTASMAAYVENGGTALIGATNAVAEAWGLFLGGARNGAVDQLGGALAITETLWLGGPGPDQEDRERKCPDPIMHGGHDALDGRASVV